MLKIVTFWLLFKTDWKKHDFMLLFYHISWYDDKCYKVFYIFCIMEFPAIFLQKLSDTEYAISMIFRFQCTDFTVFIQYRKVNWICNGKYDFSGWSYYQPLYTNYKFTGKTTYSLFVKNESTSNTLKVYAQNATQTFAQTQIAANSSSWITFSGMNTSTQFYLRFEGTSGGYYSFSGYINWFWKVFYYVFIHDQTYCLIGNDSWSSRNIFPLCKTCTPVSLDRQNCRTCIYMGNY